MATSTANSPVWSSSFFQHRRGGLPVVAVLAGDDQRLVGRRRRGRGPQSQPNRQREAQFPQHHGVLLQVSGLRNVVQSNTPSRGRKLGPLHFGVNHKGHKEHEGRSRLPGGTSVVPLGKDFGCPARQDLMVREQRSPYNPIIPKKVAAHHAASPNRTVDAKVNPATRQRPLHKFMAVKINKTPVNIARPQEQKTYQRYGRPDSAYSGCFKSQKAKPTVEGGFRRPSQRRKSGAGLPG